MNLPLLATNFPLTPPASSGWLSSIARVDGRTNKGSSHPIQAARAPCARSIQDRVLLSCRCLAQICRAGDSGTPIRLVPLMVKQVEIADRARFGLPINAG